MGTIKTSARHTKGNTIDIDLHQHYITIYKFQGLFSLNLKEAIMHSSSTITCKNYMAGLLLKDPRALAADALRTNW